MSFCALVGNSIIFLDLIPVFSEAICTGCINGDDVKELGDHVLGGRRFLVVENHEFGSTSVFDDVPDKLKSEPDKPIRMRDDNLVDASLKASVQNGSKTWSLPVDSASNITTDNSMSWISISRTRFLSLQVIKLSSGRNAGVYDLGPRRRCSISRAAGGGCGCVSLDESVDVIIVSSSSTTLSYAINDAVL